MNTHTWFKRAVATLMTSSLLFAEIVPIAYAATDIADVPMAVKTRAKPNLLLVYDDSGSMDSEVLLPTNDGALWWNTTTPSFFGWNSNDTYSAPTGTVGTLNVNKLGTADATWKKYVYLFPNGTSATDDRVYADSTHDHFAIPPTDDFAFVRSHAYNPLYYNPAVQYTPWVASNDGTSTTTYGNATTTAAKSHPALGTSTVNLTTAINSNTSDWTFRMYPGMTAPSGASYQQNGAGGWTVLGAATAVTAGNYWDVQISYNPSTYYLVDASGTIPAWPGSSTMLKKYVIQSGSTYARSADRTDCAANPCTYAEEMQNFANWFSFYRKRRLMMNKAVGTALSDITQMRGGLLKFSSSSPASQTMYNFDDPSDTLNVKRLLGALYPIDTSGGTPTRQALDYAGVAYKLTGVNAPIQYECQQNVAFVMTDGYASTGAPPSNPGNYDGQAVSTTYPYGGVAPYADTYSDSIADVAMKYYTENLRPDLTAGKVPTYTATINPDMNTNLHMNTYALGLGVKGTIFGTGSASDLNPFSSPPTWPDSNVARNPVSVDDLWHAALNGRGQMLAGSDPEDAARKLLQIFNDVLGKSGAAAAVAVSNANVISGDNAAYVSSYNSGTWDGNLKSFPIDLGTGVPNTATPNWGSSAQAQLDARNLVTTPRKIATFSGSAGVGFNTSVLTTTPINLQSLLNTPFNPPGPSDWQGVVNYLRGDRAGEGGAYRVRVHLLGDIVNSEPVLVREPRANYTDAGYAAFKTTQATRTRIVYQGANDGMLHAFNAGVYNSGTQTFSAGTGAEEWAYIPGLLFNSRPSGYANTSSLVNLAFKTGFKHLFYVDGTPTAGDVDFVNTNGGSGTTDWRTILVGGLRKGGKGYYALDVTTPTAGNDAAVASKVLWEFPNFSTGTQDRNNIGYSFGKPIIVKTQAEGWVVLVTSGYNNDTGTGGTAADGRGHLFVLNARTGAIIKDIATGVGSQANPSGLAQISAYVQNGDVDNTVDYVYGGDLQGNLWRFDLSGNATGSWNAKKLATLVDGSNNFQPITTAPELAELNSLNKRIVYVGTGRYLGDTDLPGVTGANSHAIQTQTMYALIDDKSNAPNINATLSNLRPSLQAQTITQSGSTVSISTTSVDYATKKGWYADLPNNPGVPATLTTPAVPSTQGQRIVTDPVLVNGKLVFTTNVPNSLACAPGGSSWIYQLDYALSTSVPGSTLFGTAAYLGNSLASRPTIIMLPSGATKALTRQSDETTIVTDTGSSGGAASKRRVSWRELITE